MKNTKKIISKILIYFVLILGVLFCLVPLYWMIRSSLMNTVEVFMMPPRWIPSKFMWENYQEVFDTLPFGKYFLNSFIVTGGCVVGTMLTSSICAYGLARIKWRGRNVVFACIISSMMLPFAVTLIPTFLMWRTIGITDSFIPLIVPAWFEAVHFTYSCFVSFIWESRRILMRRISGRCFPYSDFYKNYPANYKTGPGCCRYVCVFKFLERFPESACIFKF